MRSYYNVVTPPSTGPVSLSEVKSFCRIGHADDDTLLVTLIRAAVPMAEKESRHCFVSRPIIGYFTNLGESRLEILPFLQIHRTPILAISSIDTADEVGAWTTLDDSTYDLRQNSGGFPRVFFNDAPELTPYVSYPIRIQFTAGYSAIPDDIKLAVMMTVNFWYENRDDVVADGNLAIPPGATAILKRNYKVIDTF